MNRFFSIAQALEHVTNNLIPARHNYIVNILGPSDVDVPEDALPQVTSHHMEFHDSDLGLTIALPFDAGSAEYDALGKALDLDLDRLVTSGALDGVLHSFVNLGSDVRKGAQVVLYLLEHVAGFAPGTEYVCVVHDEGPI